MKLVHLFTVRKYLCRHVKRDVDLSRKSWISWVAGAAAARRKKSLVGVIYELSMVSTLKKRSESRR